jgi:response regulator RpfG family c-di-GMP phosphodiesterase
MQRGRIPIVDDDLQGRDVLTYSLIFADQYDTQTAGDGFRGVDKVRLGDFDDVFTDLKMPGVSRMDFMRETVKFRYSLPMVAITGHAGIDNVINTRRERTNYFITKPFNVFNVTSIADDIIDERRHLGTITQGDGRHSFIESLDSEYLQKLQELSILNFLSIAFDAGSNDIECMFATGNHYLAAFGEINPLSGLPLQTPLLVARFTANNKVSGIISISNEFDDAAFTPDEVSLVLTIAKETAQRMENNMLYEVFYNNLIIARKSHTNNIKTCDSFTKQHARRGSGHALETAEAMSTDAKDRDALRFGVYLYVIGTIGVRNAILLKPDRLTPEEKTEIILHPVIGENIIKQLQLCLEEREIIRHHHEHFDGSGYPDCLSGSSIPLCADTRCARRLRRHDLITPLPAFQISRQHCWGTEKVFTGVI